MNALLAVGLGYSAAAIAARLDGWRIIGTARSEAGLAEIASRGHEAVSFDGSAASPALRSAIGEATHLLVSAPPEADGDPLLRHHADGLRQAPNLGWIGYLSTVGVYGDHQGAWVDEATPPSPISLRSRWRWEAERAWQELILRRWRSEDLSEYR